MPKGYRVDAATVEAARLAVAQGASIPDVAKQFGLSTRTIKQYVESPAGSKASILAALASRDPRPMDVDELSRLVGVDKHSLVHQVWALQKQQLVSFHESNGTPTGIILTSLGARRAREQRPTNGRTAEAPVPVVEQPAKVAARPDQLYDPEEWPELRRIAGQTRAVLQAAEALAGVEGLEDVAELVRDSVKRTPVEDEYLRFVTQLNERLWRDAQTH